MMKSYLHSMLVAGVSLLLVSAAWGQTYEIDPVHSNVEFKIKHLGISTVTGHFRQMKGEVMLDEANPKIDVMVQASSVDTDSAQRDTHLKSADFFNAALYPTLAFHSTKIEKTGEGQYAVTGDFMMHGVTQSITFPMTVSEEVKGMKGEGRRGGSAEFTLKRTDFGMTKMVGPVADEVKVELDFEGVRK